MMIVLDMPEPPSVNALYANNSGGGRGRFKTPEYKAWQTECLLRINAMRGGDRCVKGSYLVTIFLHEKTRKDVDNCIKATLDMLKHAGITEDDSKCYGVGSVRSPDVAKGRCKIVVKERTADQFPFICVSDRAAAALRSIEEVT